MKSHRWDDEPEDYSDDEVAPWDEDSDEETFECPHCGEAVYEDAEQCPHCSTYLSEEDAPPTVKPLWFVAGVIAVLAIVFLWMFLLC
jgi:hypothetical protein